MLSRLKTELSGPFAFVMTQYFGGVGTQAAALVEGGEIRLGPLVGEGSINRVLASLGVRVSGETRDEFEAVGLFHWRSTEKIIDPAG